MASQSPLLRIRKFEDQYLPAVAPPETNYLIETTERKSDEPYFPDKTFRILNRGKVVEQYETTGQITAEFDPVTGILLIWLNGKQKVRTILIRPGKESKQIYKGDFIIGSARLRSPGKRFIVTDRSVIIDVEGGKVRDYNPDHSSSSPGVVFRFSKQ